MWKIRIISCIALLALILHGGCSKKEAPLPPPPPPPVVEKKLEPSIPKIHIFETLLEKHGELKQYGLYTYVLFGVRVDDPSSLDIRTRDLYNQLLNTIINQTKAKEDVEGIWSPSSTNIFYIPGKKRFVAGEWSLTDYNSHLAMTYIAQLIRITEDNSGIPIRMLTRPGPFLISTLKPLGDMGSDTNNILYADLSDSHPEAVTQIVNEYKNFIVEKSVDEVQQFESLKLSLLNFILRTNDNLKIVKTALADWID